MTTDEIVALGTYCEGVRSADLFKVLVDQYELNCFQHFVSTAAHEQKKRDGIYANFNALKDFLGLMDAVIAAKSNIEIALSAKDAPEDIN